MNNPMEDTIVAPISGTGMAAISVLRISGERAFDIANKLLSKDMLELEGYTVHYTNFMQGENTLDQVLVNCFRAPKSFTGEDIIEISFHGSTYIISKALELLIEEGARMAKPGEFSMRAYLNGRMDLAQAEAVADLIQASSKAAHDMALYQLKGAYSTKIEELRKDLIKFSSLLELELDFSEEDVEFADRTSFLELIDKTLEHCQFLADSFQAGNVIKNGIPVAIVGPPNAGKSTLLNHLLKDNRAIVSDIAGTTRDTIEDSIRLGGQSFRFIDTAGIRETEDVIEKLGIDRSFQTIEKAKIVLWMQDLSKKIKESDYKKEKEQIKKHLQNDAKLISIANKSDVKLHEVPDFLEKAICISAKDGIGTNRLEQKLIAYASSLLNEDQEMVVSNLRHYEALKQCIQSLQVSKEGLQSGLSSELVAFDLRQAMQALGSITGEISNEEVLGSIFSEFCIGK